MVADKVTVISKTFGANEGYKWKSEGCWGYTIEPIEKDTNWDRYNTYNQGKYKKTRIMMNFRRI